MKPNASLKQDLTKHKASWQKRLQDEITPHSETPYLDSVVLLTHITGSSKSQILANPDPDLDPHQEKQLQDAITRIKGGTPLPYVIGEWEFFQESFHITEDVLIPRPETEGLVDLALTWLKTHAQRRIGLEIGTGSGCIAVSLLKHIPDLEMIATDISKEALLVAQENAQRHRVDDRIQFQQRDLLNEFTDQVDLLIANLPYIPTGKLKSLPVFHHEPRIALDGGSDGLHYISRVLIDVREHLRPGGAIFLELDEDSGAAALLLARDVWPGRTLTLSQDLSGQDRYLMIES
jgi:release factor glutamine methyltransferase